MSGKQIEWRDYRLAGKLWYSIYYCLQYVLPFGFAGAINPAEEEDDKIL